MADKEKKANSNHPANLAGIVLPKFIFDSHTSTLGKLLIVADRGPTDREILALRKKIADATQNASVYLAEYSKEQAEASDYLGVSRRHLATNQGGDALNNFLKAEENLNRALVIIHRISKTTESIKRMIVIVIITAIVYLAIIALLAISSNLKSDFSLLGVPGLVLSWACLGGITAILFHRRSMMEKKWPFELRWFWIIIRPLLGMIMGAFMYLGVVSGLLLYGASSIQGKPQQQILWALAFVGGFSDRFWEMLISSVLGPHSDEKNAGDTRGLKQTDDQQ